MIPQATRVRNLRNLRNLAALSVVLLCAACALGGGDTRYRLIAPEVPPLDEVAGEPVDAVVGIARPETDRTRDSSRILVRRGRTLLPWPEAAWIDRAPDLVQRLMVESFDGRLAIVGRHGSVPADHRLDLVLRRFEFVESESGLEAEMDLVARLFAADGRLVGTRSLSVREPVTAGDSVGSAVAAFETAMTRTFSDLAAWLRPRLSESG